MGDGAYNHLLAITFIIGISLVSALFWALPFLFNYFVGAILCAAAYWAVWFSIKEYRDGRI